MSGISVGFVNKFFGADLTAREQDQLWPVTNLDIGWVFPAYRSGDRAISLNGTDESAFVAVDSDFQFTTSFVIEAVVTRLSNQGASVRLIIGQGLFAAIDGWGLWINDSEIAVRVPDGAANNYVITTTSPISVGASKHIKVTYDGSGTPAVTIRVDGVLLATATVGTIPATLGVSAGSLNMGSYGSVWLNAEIAFVGARSGTGNNDAWLDPTACAVYYPFEDDAANPTDISGNGHDMTGVNISAADYVDYTGWQWIQIVSPDSFQPTTLIIDRRHNLQTGAVVELWRRSTTASTRSLIASTTATAGEAIVLTFSAPSTTPQYTIEINDDTNPDGYISIPIAYLGTIEELEHSWVNDAKFKNRYNVISDDSQAGVSDGIQTSKDKIWQLEATYEPGDVTDQEAMEDAIEAGVEGLTPIVLKDDEGVWRHVKVTQPEQGYMDQSTTLWTFPSLKFEELSRGI